MADEANSMWKWRLRSICLIARRRVASSASSVVWDRAFPPSRGVVQRLMSVQVAHIPHDVVPCTLTFLIGRGQGQVTCEQR
jgi:hypothetical protein